MTVGGESKPRDLIVLGGGVTGLTAAGEAARSGLDVLCLAGGDGLLGGLVVNVGVLDGFPHGQTTSGMELAATLIAAATADGAKIEFADAQGMQRVGGHWRVETETGDSHTARAVLAATGARLRRLGVPGEDELTGRGVSQCAYCDGAFFKDETVAVVGGGDAALQEALHLAEMCGKIELVTRGPALRARPDYVRQATEDAKFAFHWNSTVEAVLGEEAVTGVRVVSDGQRAEIACTGVFVFIGLEPTTDCLPDLSRDEAGCLTTDGRFRTGAPGIYAAGAVRSGYGGLLVHATEEAAAAVGSIREDLSAETA